MRSRVKPFVAALVLTLASSAAGAVPRQENVQVPYPLSTLQGGTGNANGYSKNAPPTSVPNGVMQYDASGNPIAAAALPSALVVPVSQLGGVTATIVGAVNNLIELKAINPATISATGTIFRRGFAVSGDGGAADYIPSLTNCGVIAGFGTITGGSGGTPGVYSNVALTGGAGAGALGVVTVAAGGNVSLVQVLSGGAGYGTGGGAAALSAASTDIGGVTGFSVNVNSAAGDDGYHVQPSVTGCYTAAVPTGGLPIQVWGALPSVIFTNGSDDSAAISKALSSGVPVSCSGAFDLARPAVFVSGTNLTGNACTFYLDNANTTINTAQAMYGKNAKNVSVKGVVFEGNSVNITNLTARLVYVDGGNNVVFDGDTWQNANGVGVVFGGFTYAMSNSGVKNSTFNNIGNFWNQGTGGTWTNSSGPLSQANSASTFTGVQAFFATNVGNFFTGNTLTKIGSDGIDVTYNQNIKISANNFFFNGNSWRPSTSNPPGTYGTACIYFPFLVTSFVTGATITNNVCNGTSAGSLQIAGNNLTITGNIITNAGGSGIGAGGGTVVLSGNVISQNVIIDANQSVNTPYSDFLDGINLGCYYNGLNCSNGGLINSTITGNVIIDDQGTPTMRSGISANVAGYTLTNTTIDSTNIITGGTGPKFNGAIAGPTSPTEAYYTVATLPTCNSSTQNTTVVVTDATAPTYNAALTGGGAVKTPAFCNMTSWTAH